MYLQEEHSTHPSEQPSGDTEEATDAEGSRHELMTSPKIPNL